MNFGRIATLLAQVRGKPETLARELNAEIIAHMQANPDDAHAIIQEASKHLRNYPSNRQYEIPATGLGTNR